ncbi:MAG: ring-cleaving dioxygenase [Bradyrhizobiaceae bacterium]|nr:ring-cleaving dioxygenase [Bradyrhizobiaceae bacterium]
MPGIHHVTAVAGKPNRNLDFYTRVLGLRLVKKTVNFDDPGTYHFYYGNETGEPGTILTFFPWEKASPGRAGVGLAQETALRVPAASLGYWTHRLVKKGVEHGPIERRFDEPVLTLTDPDGMRLALVGIQGAESETAFTNGKIAAENAIRGFHGITLMLAEAAPTAALLTGVFGFKEVARDGTRVRYRAADARFGNVIDIREAIDFLPGRMGRGSVHHVAFRAADDDAQAEMADKAAKSYGLHHTEQKDRQYFRSVYFREPGGVLFEIATDQPGFTADETVERLGTELKLPRFLEPHRREIEEVLPELAQQPAPVA